MSTWAIPSHAEWAVPGYTVDGLIGDGVSGRVVAAVRDADGQRVAIKYLNGDLVRDSEFLGAFRLATERLISLNAPHVVRVFDYAEQPGTGAAAVTELVNGVSLRRMIAHRGPLGAKAALVVFKDSLLGLAAAHARHVAHCDVKPGNVLIDAAGQCTLIDFGIAVRTDKQVPAPGTPEYMAPELWNGAPNFPATDMYAATVMLGESLTGTPPFTGRPGRLREQHETAPVPLDEYDPPLRDLIAWGMDKYSDQRPPSAWVFADQVDARAAAAYGPYWEVEGRRELAWRAEELLRGLAGDGGPGDFDPALAARRSRRKLAAVVSVAAVLVVAGAAAGGVMLTKKPGVKLQSVSKVSAAQVTTAVSSANPVLAATCIKPATFTFTGSITDQQPGQVSYQWVYSTGQADPVQTLNFAVAGEQPVTNGTLATSTAGEGWAQLKVLLNPGTKVSSRAAFSLLCSKANSDITMTVTMAPASQNYASCAVPRPAVTALGNITSKNAGVVTYYWALSDGTRTKPAQLTFTGPGTQAAKSEMFLAAVPSSGTAELVVTKPAVAVSKPAAYKVTCQGGAAVGPTQAAPTAKASVSPKVTKSATPTATKSATPGPTTPAPTTPAPTLPTPTLPTPTLPSLTPTPSPSGTATGG